MTIEICAEKVVPAASIQKQGGAILLPSDSQGPAGTGDEGIGTSKLLLSMSFQ